MNAYARKGRVQQLLDLMRSWRIVSAISPTCDVDGRPLRRNHPQQSMRFCSDRCRKLRHNQRITP